MIVGPPFKLVSEAFKISRRKVLRLKPVRR